MCSFLLVKNSWDLATEHPICIDLILSYFRWVCVLGGVSDHGCPTISKRLFIYNKIILLLLFHKYCSYMQKPVPPQSFHWILYKAQAMYLYQQNLHYCKHASLNWWCCAFSVQMGFYGSSWDEFYCSLCSVH